MEALLTAVVALVGMFGAVVYGYAKEHRKNGYLDRENEELKVRLVHANKQVERANAPLPEWDHIVDASERLLHPAEGE